MTLLLFDAIIVSCQDSSVGGASVAITFRLDVAEKDDWMTGFTVIPVLLVCIWFFSLSSFLNFFYFNPNVFIKGMLLPRKYITLIKKSL